MEKTKLSIVVGAFLWAVVISAVALMLPPRGVIDSSVLILVAQLLILVSTIVGVNLPVIIKQNGNNHPKNLA